jgi:hypothetical protein
MTSPVLRLPVGGRRHDESVLLATINISKPLAECVRRVRGPPGQIALDGARKLSLGRWRRGRKRVVLPNRPSWALM